MGTAPFASAHADLFTENDVNTIKAGIKGNGVLSGCAVSWTSGLTVTVAAGLVLENGLTVAIAEGAVVLTPDSSLPMMATIYATGGVITVQYGDPAAVVKKTATDTFFQYYAPIPATLTTGIILAQVYIPPTGDMDATMVLDKRILLNPLQSPSPRRISTPRFPPLPCARMPGISFPITRITPSSQAPPRQHTTKAQLRPFSCVRQAQTQSQRTAIPPHTPRRGYSSSRPCQAYSQTLTGHGTAAAALEQTR